MRKRIISKEWDTKLSVKDTVGRVKFWFWNKVSWVTNEVLRSQRNGITIVSKSIDLYFIK